MPVPNLGSSSYLTQLTMNHTPSSYPVIDVIKMCKSKGGGQVPVPTDDEEEVEEDEADALRALLLKDLKKKSSEKLEEEVGNQK